MMQVSKYLNKVILANYLDEIRDWKAYFQSLLLLLFFFEELANVF